MKRFLSATGAILLVLSAHGALANQHDESNQDHKPEGRDEIVVFGRAIQTPGLPPITAVSVIDRDEIERLNVISAADLLRERVGVDVRSVGGPGKQTSVFLRGSASDQVRVLIDGVPVGSTTTAAFDWPYLATHDIERIEVHRGPQSALYGSAAMGGVIQIFTKRAEPGIEGSLRGSFGSLGTRSAEVRLAGATESGLGATFSATHLTTNSVSAAFVDPAIDRDPETDPFRNTSVATTLTVPLGDGSVDFFYRRADAQTEIDGFGPADDETPEQFTVQNQFGADLKMPVTDDWTTRLLLSQNDNDLFGRDDDPTNMFALFNEFEIESTRRQVSWTNDVRLGSATLLSGADLEKDRVRSTSQVFGGGRTSLHESARRIGVFGLARHEGERFSIEAGARYEFNDRSDDEFTYQLAGNYTLFEGFDVVASYGTAFRAPDLNELYFPMFGNLALEPERSHGGDLGFRFVRDVGDAARLRAEVRGFHNSYEDLIIFTFVGGGFLNVDRARTSGVEANLRLDCENLWVDASYTFLDSRDNLGDPLRRRSRNTGRLSVGGSWRWLTAEAVLHVVGKSFDGAGRTNPLDSYVTADLNLSADVRENLKVGLNVRNVTDHGYQEAFGFSTLPRTVLLTAEVSF